MYEAVGQEIGEETMSKEGWVTPLRGNKDHYFVNCVGNVTPLTRLRAKTLCGRWLFWGSVVLDDVDRSPHYYDCKTCRRPLTKRPKEAVNGRKEVER